MRMRRVTAIMAEAIKVAVRIRPFNQREKNREAKLVLKASGQTVTIEDPKSSSKRSFTFDYSYWSHDGFEEDETGYFYPVNSTYADQKLVFSDLGEGILQNAWKGYNCTLFAYGQTGSGKSYSMVGYGNNKGIIPVACEKLFQEINSSQRANAHYEVSVSMMEIYNEQIRDLLDSKSMASREGLKLREHPIKGFYVEGLHSIAVQSYADIERLLAEGTKNRTIAATNMNATSSRAHTIFAINFVQKEKSPNGQLMSKTSVINLVDLAGSERADATGATGARLSEGASINKSLSTLGNVIRALAENAAGKKIKVPFRDSVLTKILKNALGGNSKTILIAALSPADINYDETLSTLRFAEQVKKVKNKATVNESATDALIRQLREENNRLMNLLKSGNYAGQDENASKEEIERVRKEMEIELAKQMEQNRIEISELQKSWEQKLAESQKLLQGKEKSPNSQQQVKDRSKIPHLWNLHEDPQLTDVVVHYLKPKVNYIGCNSKDVQINGLSIQPKHAVIDVSSKDISLAALNGAKVAVNGKPLINSVTLHHNDRILFGSSHLYVLHHPKEAQEMLEKGIKPEKVTYTIAQEEIAQSSGFDIRAEGKGKEAFELQEQLLTLLPMIYEANAISEELNKQVTFEIILISPKLKLSQADKTEVMVKMRNLITDNWWLWPMGKFFERRYIMLDIYHRYVDGKDINLPKDSDPFWEPNNIDVLIGYTHVYLQGLAYMIEMETELSVTDFRGQKQGSLMVKVSPCYQDGTLPSEAEDDLFVEDPNDLIGKAVNFQLHILSAHNLPEKCIHGTYCKFHFYLDKEEYTTPIATTINPVFNYRRQITVPTVTQQFLQLLADQPLLIEVWCRQQQDPSDPEFEKQQQLAGIRSKQSTRQLMNEQLKKQGNLVAISTNMRSEVPDELTLLQTELATLRITVKRLESKLKRVQEAVDKAKARGEEIINVSEIENALKDKVRNFSTVAKVVALANRGQKATEGAKSSDHADTSVTCSTM